MCSYGQLVLNLIQLDLSVLFSICSVHFSHSVMSISLQRLGLQLARLPYASPTPGAYSSSCPSTWWCHPTISSSVFPFSSCLQSLLISVSFPMSQLFPSGGQIIGASASGLPVNIRDWFFFFSFLFFLSFFLFFFFFRIDWLDLLAVQGTLNSLLQHHSLKGIYVCHLSVMSYSPCWDLTTRTECKQHAKMRIKSQCSI